MKQPPFFSIVLPTYNRAELLSTAIKSVLAQSYSNWELIIVDDGSTDNTTVVVRQFEDERIKYIYQTNAERSAARNMGITNSTGSYICFLDSDDYYLFERLELLYSEITKRNCPGEMFYTGVMIDKEGKLTRQATDYKRYENVFDNIARNFIGCPQACISREILSEFKYDTKFKIGEDMELWLRIAQKYPVTYLNGQFTFVALEHDDRSVNVMRYNSGAEQLKLYHQIFSDGHSGKKISRKVKLFMMAGAYHAIARYNIHRGYRWNSVIAILRAMCADMRSDWFKFRVNIFLRLISFSPMEKIKKLIDYQ